MSYFIAYSRAVECRWRSVGARSARLVHCDVDKLSIGPRPNRRRRNSRRLLLPIDDCRELVSIHELKWSLAVRLCGPICLPVSLFLSFSRSRLGISSSWVVGSYPPCCRRHSRSTMRLVVCEFLSVARLRRYGISCVVFNETPWL